jgi:hypothetical protein
MPSAETIRLQINLARSLPDLDAASAKVTDLPENDADAQELRAHLAEMRQWIRGGAGRDR